MAFDKVNQEEIRNAQYFLSLVEKDPKEFWDVPKKFRSAKLCKLVLNELGYKNSAEAIKAKPEFFAHFHTSLLDHDAILEYVQSSHFRWIIQCGMVSFPAFNWGYKDFTIEGATISSDRLMMSYDICVALVQADPRFIAYVPDVYRNEALYTAAVNANGNALSQIPADYRTQELCLLAYEKDRSCFSSIPDEFKTSQMCLQAITENGGLLRSVPEKLKTREMCIIAVTQSGNNIVYVPERMLDQEITLLAIKNAPKSETHFFSKIPEKCRDHDACLAAVTRDGNDLVSVPEKEKNYDICLAAAKGMMYSGSFDKECAKKHFPYECFTPELCMVLARKGADYFALIPKECLTYEVCLAAVSRTAPFGGTVIRDIPYHLITQELCDTAFKTSVGSYGGIPDEFVTEDMILYLAENFPMKLPNTLPNRFDTADFIHKMVEKIPSKYWEIKKKWLSQV